MDYQRIYDDLMARAQNRIYHSDVYVEKHHILPRCLGGTDDASNLVALLPEEHVFAHRLLAKMHPRHQGLAYAVLMLCRVKYGRASRRIYAMDKQRMSCARKGKKHSEASKAKISASHKARHTPKPIKPRKVPKPRHQKLPGYSIGEFAKALGVHVNTVRNWDKQGKLSATRIATSSTVGHRRYTDQHLVLAKSLLQINGPK